MDSTNCITPANSLTSLEKAKLCNTLMHKIKSTQSKKIIFRNPAEPAEPNDYEKAVSTVYADTVINIDDIKNNSYKCYNRAKPHEKKVKELGTYYELDVNKLTSDIRIIEHNLEQNLLDNSSLEDNTIKNYMDEEKSDDDVSIIHAKEVIAHYKNYKSRLKATVHKKNDPETFVNISQHKDQALQSYLYYSMLLFLLCTFCLILVFL